MRADRRADTKKRSGLLICGYTGFNNLGDEAVLGRLAAYAAPHCGVTVISGDPAHTRKAHGVAAFGRKNIGAFISSTVSSACLVLGGGTLFQTRSGPLSQLYYAFVAQTAVVFRLPFVIYGGIDNKNTVTRLVCARARYLILRDSRSLKLSREMGFAAKTVFAPDPVSIRADYPDEAGDRRPWGRYIVCTPNNGERRAACAAAYLSKKYGVKTVFLAMHQSDDCLCRCFAKATGGVFMANGSLDFRKVERLIAGAALTVSSRLHGCVMAYSAGVPLVAFAHDDKISAFVCDTGGHRAAGGAGTVYNGQTTRAERSLYNAKAIAGLSFIVRQACGILPG